MTELEKLRKGEYYRMNDTEIDNIQTRAITLCQQFNSLSITEKKERENLLRELLGSVGNNPQLKPGSSVIPEAIFISEIILLPTTM